MRGPSGVAPEALTALPKGGAASRAVDDTFAPRLSTGSIAYRIPLVMPRGRVDKEVELALGYDQLGEGISPFGLGWGIVLPNVRRRTRLGVPGYDQNDVLVLTSGEELVPVGGGEYRTRVEGFRRIRRQGDGWEITEPDGTRYDLGIDAEHRVADPDDPARVFEWLVARRTDTNDNVVEYRWRHDDLHPRAPDGRPGNAAYPHEVRWCHAADGRPLCAARFVYDFAGPGEERPDAATSLIAGFPQRASWRCRAIVSFCADLATPGLGALELAAGHPPGSVDALAFVATGAIVEADGGVELERWAAGTDGIRAGRAADLHVDLPIALSDLTAELQVSAGGRYDVVAERIDGSTDTATVVAAGAGPQILPLGGGNPTPIRRVSIPPAAGVCLLQRLRYGAGSARPAVASRYDLEYHLTATEAGTLDRAAVAPTTSQLASVTRVGYDVALTEARMPPIRLEYTRVDLVNLWPDQIAGTPAESLSDPDTTLISFTGNARVDVLQTLDGHRCFLNGGRVSASVAMRGRELDSSPQVDLSEPGTSLRDVNGRGSVDLSTETFFYNNPATSPTPVDPNDLSWGDYQTFSASDPHPVLTTAERSVTRAIDLDGNGAIDLLQTGSDFVTWSNLGDHRWSPPQRQPRQHSFGGREWPDVNFDDPSVTIADMNGDGLDEVVRTSARKVEYWAQVRGRFEFKQTMLRSPRIRNFNPRRCFVTDLTNDGFADLIYVGSGRVSVWLNQGGTRFGPELVIDLSDPAISRGVRIPDDADTIEPVDLAGEGIKGILWSFTRAGTEGNYYFLPLTRGPKPGLLKTIDNGLGGLIELEWTTSAVEAALAEALGDPWSAHSPFPVSVVKRIRKVDRIAGSVEECDLGYRDAHHDRLDRRFLGFRQVTETFVGDESGAARRIVHEFETRDVLRLADEPLAAARALAGRESRVRHIEADTGRLLEETVTTWAARPVNSWSVNAAGAAVPTGIVNPLDPLAQPRLVVATHELRASWEGSTSPRYRLLERHYDAPGYSGVPDEFGNLREELDYGEVAESGIGPPIATLDVGGTPVDFYDTADEAARLTRYRYAVNRSAHIVAYVSVEEVWVGPGFGRLVSETRSYYDGGASRDDHLSLGEVDQGNLQRREQLVAFEDEVAADFGAAFLGRIGAGAANGPAYLLRAAAADGRRALFAIELRRRYVRSAGRIVYGLVLGHYGPRGSQTAFAYDAEQWAPAGVTNALNQLTTVRRYSYVCGEPERLEDGNGTVSRNDLDQFGRVVATWADDSAGAPPDVEWEYDFDVHRLGADTFAPVSIEQRQVIDRLDVPVRHVRTLTYLDGFGRELQRRQSAEPGAAAARYVVTARGYGAHPLVAREWLPYFEAAPGYAVPSGARPVRLHRYDGLGRLVETIWPDGSLDRVEREPWAVVEHDREDTSLNSPHYETPRRIESDAAGRMARVLERVRYLPTAEDAIVETRLHHDVNGRLIERRDPSGFATTTTWTANGRYLVRRHPDAGERLSFHDAAGNRIYERDARGTAIWFRYDAIDRVTAEVRAAGPAGAADITYTYDDAATNGIGRLCSATTAATGDGVTFEYDSRGNVTRATRTIDGQVYDFREEHNALGLLRQKTYPDGDVLEQRFGLDGRIVATAHTPAATGNRFDMLSAIAWTADGQLGRLEILGGAVTVDVAYDPDTQRIESVTVREGAGTTVHELTYTRDLMGNALTVRDGSAPGSPITETYTYDSAYQLRTAALAGAGVPAYAYSYAYEANGRIRRNGELAAADYVYDPAHPNAPTGTVGAAADYAYDDAGNMVATPSLRLLVWNVRGQLEEAHATGDVFMELYRYDHDGTRIHRELRLQGASPTVVAYADHDYVVRDGAPAVAIMLGETRIGEIDAAGGVELFLVDQLSSVRGAVDGAGAPIAAMAERFRPFGGTHVAPTVTKPYRFAGRERDGSGLYWFDGRYYDPEIAAWSGVDPAGQFHSPYVFTGGNPVNLVERDATDAVAIVFPDYKITAAGTKWGDLGHAGVLLINNRTGLTKYYEYGRYDKAQIGLVRTRTVPNVQLKDGRPTKESLAVVLKSISTQISKHPGHPTRIEGAIVRTDKFKEMNQYAHDRLKLNTDKTREEYNIFSNNCGTFMVSTIEASGVDVPSVVDPRPTSIIEEIRSEQQTVDWSAKKGLKLGKPVDQRQPAATTK